MSKIVASQHIAFEICSLDLVNFESSLAFYTFNHPKLLIQIFDEALYASQMEISSHSSFEQKHGTHGTVKHNAHVRLINLPSTAGYSKSLISEIQADDIGKLFEISGTIIKTSSVKLLEVSKQYQCKRQRCGYRFRVYADPEQDNQIPLPRRCPSKPLSIPNTNTNNTNDENTNKACPSQEFIEVDGSKVCVDYQEIKIQDPLENLGVGAAPRSMTVVLKADLVDKFNPGDKVSITGKTCANITTINV